MASETNLGMQLSKGVVSERSGMELELPRAGCNPEGLSSSNSTHTMIWSATTRARYKCERLSTTNDLTDAGWTRLEQFLPAPVGVGRPPGWRMCEVVDATFYVRRGGIGWRTLPPCFSPRRKVRGRFAKWRHAGAWVVVAHRLVMSDHERGGHGASPSAAVVTAFRYAASAMPLVSRSARCI